MNDKFRTCDKCGYLVDPQNNALLFEDHLIDVRRERGEEMSHLALLGAKSRHLLPVTEGDKVICTGSPSRAQYLEGQPRDPRYPYRIENEAIYREAYQNLLKGIAAEA